MKVGDLCAKSVVTVDGSAGLSAAAEMMRDKHIGYLVVVEPDVRHNAFRPVGVLTDRDLVVAVLARDASDLGPLAEDWRRVDPDPKVPAWTDDYSDILRSILRFKGWL